jgi:hypothetical protein
MTGEKEATVLEGGCHCGQVRYRFTRAPHSEALAARRCECRFCRGHGAAYTGEPDGKLAIELAREGAVRPYRFASQVVDFLLCSHCGVLTAALSRIDGRTYAVINANTLDRPIGVQPARVDFSDETPGQAEARRKRHWIGRVTVQVAAKAVEEQRPGVR